MIVLISNNQICKLIKFIFEIIAFGHPSYGANRSREIELILVIPNLARTLISHYIRIMVLVMNHTADEMC